MKTGNLDTVRTLSCTSALTLLLLCHSAGAQVAVQGEPISIQNSRPGKNYSGAFAIRNGTSVSQEVRVYQTDYLDTPTGTLYGEPAGRIPRSNARWIALGPARITVPPNKTLDIPYSVTVPDTLSETGSYWSMVMVETIPRGSPESSVAPAPSEKMTVAITSRFRYAVQIVTNIDSAITRDVQFLAPTALVTRDSSNGLQFDLKNIGNIAFVPKFTVELYAVDGTHVKTFTALRELTYPGNSFRQQFNFGRLAHGKYRTIVTMDAGNDALFGAQYTFTF